MKVKLALPKCDKCGHKWHSRYRRNKPAMFFCPSCGQNHPRWTTAQIDMIADEADKLRAKFKPVSVAV